MFQEMATKWYPQCQAYSFLKQTVSSSNEADFVTEYSVALLKTAFFIATGIYLVRAWTLTCCSLLLCIKKTQDSFASLH